MMSWAPVNRFIRLLNSIAPGLSQEAQLEALFIAFEASPEVFETRLSCLSEKRKQELRSALEMARHYALYKERASALRRLQGDSVQFPWTLLQSLSPEIRLEAREWLGFWAQHRQGHWSQVQWVERGVRTHVNFEASDFFARCLPLRPKALVLVHNHPSGNTEPSWMDLRLTRQVGRLAHDLGIELKGHWIVGPHSETWIPLELPLEPPLTSPVPSVASLRSSASAHWSPSSPLKQKSWSSNTRRSQTKTSGALGLPSVAWKELGSK